MRRTLSICSLAGTLTVILSVVSLRKNVVLADSNTKTHGAELFASKGCVHCHGPAGVGGGKGPDLQLVRKRLSHEAIITQIHDGGKAMPPFGDQLSNQEMSDLADFLRAKRKFVVVPSKPAEKAATPSGKDPD